MEEIPRIIEHPPSLESFNEPNEENVSQYLKSIAYFHQLAIEAQELCDNDFIFPLQELFLDSVDDETILQQLQLNNEAFNEFVELAIEALEIPEESSEEEETETETLSEENDEEEEVSGDEEELEDGEFDEIEEVVEEEEEEDFDDGIEAIQNRINELEDSIIAEKTWAMKGEATAHDRDRNSLVDFEGISFDMGALTKPVLTADHEEHVNEVIKERIAASLYDDVVRIVLEEKNDGPVKELSTTKSAKSLSEIYADQYAEQKAQMTGAKTEAQIRNQVQQQELIEEWEKLSWALDSLSNFYYVPPPPTKEKISINTSASAVVMEDITPGTVSSAQVVAPEQIVSKMAKTGVTDDEATHDDRRRIRGQQKRIQSRQAEEKRERDALKQKDIDNNRAAVVKMGAKDAAAVISKGLRGVTVMEEDSSANFFKSGSSLKQIEEQRKKDLEKATI